MADVEDDQGPLSVIPGSHNGDLFNQYDADGKWTGCLQDEDLWRVPVYFDATFQIGLGNDVGQTLGSLFEVLDGAGNVLLGAGWSDIHSSYIRDNNRILNFYYKAKDVDPKVEKVGKPLGPENNGTRLIVDGGNLLAFHRWNNPFEGLSDVGTSKLPGKWPIRPGWKEGRLLKQEPVWESMDLSRVRLFRANRVLLGSRYKRGRPQ